MSRGILIGLVVVLAGVAGVFVALYIAGRRDERQRVLRQLDRQRDAQQAEPPPAPVLLQPVTEVQVSIPPPGSATA